jgi:large subunit ribosomal protein L11
MAKKVTGFIKLQIVGGSANPSPPIGPALGQKGVNIMEFCKAFNAQTQSQKGVQLPTIITVYSDRSFSFITKTPPATYLIKQGLKLKSGSKKPGHEVAGTLGADLVKSVVETKMPDLTAANIPNGMRIIEGSARSMGLKLNYEPTARTEVSGGKK